MMSYFRVSINFVKKMFKLFLVKNISDQDINTFENDPENKSKVVLDFLSFLKFPMTFHMG